MKVGDYIKSLRTAKGLTQEELGNMVGVQRAAVQKWESGLTQNLKRNIIQQLASIFGVSPSSFIQDESSQPNNDDFDIFSVPNIHPIKLKKFPLLGEIACGEPIFADEDKENFIMADCDIRVDFCLRAKGDSMINARIFDGDIVFVKQQSTVEDGEIAVVIINDEATLKRVYYDKESNVLTLMAENPRFKTMIFTDSELETISILGKAVYFMSIVI